MKKWYFEYKKKKERKALNDPKFVSLSLSSLYFDLIVIWNFQEAGICF